MTEEPLTLQVDMGIVVPFEPKGVIVITRLLSYNDVTGWNIVDTQRFEFKEERTETVALFNVTYGIYGIEFWSMGITPVEGVDFVYTLYVPQTMGTAHIGGNVLYSVPSFRRVFRIVEETGIIQLVREEGVIKPIAPTPPKPISLNTNDPNVKAEIEAQATLWDRVVNSVLGLGAPIGALQNVASGLVNAFFERLFGSLLNLFQRSSKDYGETSISTLMDMISGSPDAFNIIKENYEPISGFVLGSIPDIVNIDNWLPDDLTPENYVKNTYEMTSKLISVSVRQSLVGIAYESLTLGQVEGVSGLLSQVINQLGVNDILNKVYTLPVEKGLLLPFEHAINSTYTNEVPPYTDLVNMRVKEKIEEAEFNLNIAKLGYSEYWASKIWDAHFIPPNYGAITKAYFRGAIDYDRLLELLKRVDLDPEFNKEVWEPNIWNIPPYTDLINMRVKEVIGDETFSTAIRSHGFGVIWAKRIWDAHFIPPSLGDILTAYRRGVPVTIPTIDPNTGSPTTRSVSRLDLDDVHELMKLVDLDPRYNTIFDTRLYRDPSIREARYMYETGAIDESRVREIVIRSGLDPVYVDDMVHYLTHFVERAYQRQYLTALATAKTNDIYSNEQITDLVTKAGFTEGVAHWIVEIANVRRDVLLTPRETPKPRILTVSQLDKAYRKSLIDEDEYMTRMMALGYETLDITLKLRLLELDKVVEDEGRRVIRLTTSQLLNAWRYDEMTEDELRMELGLRGLDTLNIDRLVNSKKTQWGLEETEGG